MQHRLGHFFFGLLTLFVAYPLAGGTNTGHAILNLMMVGAIIYAYHAAGARGIKFILVALLGGGWAAASAHLFITDGAGPLVFLQLGVMLILYLVVMSRLLAHTLNAKPVTFNEIYGAFSLYLLLGMTWSILFFLAEKLNPGSILITPPGGIPRPLGFMESFYYSFTLLTPFKLPDVLPVKPLAMSLAMTEAVLGLFFMAVLVSRLVALHRKDAA